MTTTHNQHLDISTYVILKDGCTLDFSVLGSGQVEVTCGAPRDGCQLLLDAETLRQFLTLGDTALQTMDAQFARETAQETAQETSAVN